MKRTTIKDVAQQAGVSITTVSHALSGGGVVKQETRDKIRALAREMNYSPNWNGRNLKSGDTRIIGFYVQYIRGFFGVIADAMHEICQKKGYELSIIIVDKGDTIVDNLMSHKVDGAVILHDDFSSEQLHVLETAGLPAVFLDREIIGKHMSSVVFDSYYTGYQVAEYLYNLGHRKMMIVEGRNSYDSLERTRGFLDFLNQKDIELDNEYRLLGNFERVDSCCSMEHFLKLNRPMPTAIFAENDDSAFGCITALKNAGYSVPGDVSVIGCDNIELCQWWIPALTSMDTSIYQQGLKAAEEIIALVQGRRNGSLTKTPGHLVIRNSCRNIE